eukprot:620093-Rhodomonas_salina.2
MSGETFWEPQAVGRGGVEGEWPFFAYIAQTARTPGGGLAARVVVCVDGVNTVCTDPFSVTGVDLSEWGSRGHAPFRLTNDLQKLLAPHSCTQDLHAMSADSDAGVVQMARSLYAVLESYEKKMASM